MNELKYRIADLLFAKELDEAYEMGIRAGAEYATRTIAFRVNLKANADTMTKTQKQGYQVAVEIVEGCKPDIANTTGATV